MLYSLYFSIVLSSCVPNPEICPKGEFAKRLESISTWGKIVIHVFLYSYYFIYLNIFACHCQNWNSFRIGIVRRHWSTKMAIWRLVKWCYPCKSYGIWWIARVCFCPHFFCFFLNLVYLLLQWVVQNDNPLEFD